MTNFVPAASVTTAGITFNLANNDSIQVNNGINLGSTGSVVVLAASNNTIINNGNMAGVWGIGMGGGSSVDNGDTGRISGSSLGIYTFGSGSDIFNDGDIFGGAAGIHDLGSNFGHITNSGTIKAGIGMYGGHNAAIELQHNVGSTYITNTGIIQAQKVHSFAIEATGNGVEKIANSGTMFGNVALGGGNDRFNSAAGKVVGTIDGGAGNDVIRGTAFADKILGGSGNDTLFGLAGNDKITGNVGHDTLSGGVGADQFIFLTTGDSTAAAAGRDTILDFRHAQHDRINLAAIDADSGAGGNQAFHFIGTGAFGFEAGELRYVKAGANTLIQGDTNGDGIANFSILVKGLPHLGAGVFFL